MCAKLIENEHALNWFCALYAQTCLQQAGSNSNLKLAAATGSRDSVFECVAIFDFLKDQGQVTENDFSMYYSRFEEISKMLFGLIKGLE